MTIAKAVVALLLSSFLSFHQAEGVGVRGREAKNNNKDDCLACNVGRSFVTHESGHQTTSLICVATDEDGNETDLTYDLSDLPKDFLEKYSKHLHRGNARICIPKKFIDPSTGKVNFSSSVNKNNKNNAVAAADVDSPRLLSSLDEEEDDETHMHHRRLASTGTRTVLVVRVTSTAGEEPGINSTQIAGLVFGQGPMAQAANLISQYSSCSHGVLNVVPVSYPPAAPSGILEYVYSGTISGKEISTGSPLYTSLTTGVAAAVGKTSIRSVANQVMFCVPGGTKVSGGGWASWTNTNGAPEFYNYGNCRLLSFMMHENGHSMGFVHSGNGTDHTTTGTDQYQDRSCYMGFGYNQIGTPRMCFNAHKYFISGWFETRKTTINPVTNGAWGGTLIPGVDFVAAVGTLPSAVVVVNVGTYYLHLNSAKSFTIDTKVPNKVLIVQADSPGSVSWFQAGLGAGEAFALPNYSGTTSLIFKVCSITFDVVDTAQITIYLDDGIQVPAC